MGVAWTCGCGLGLWVGFHSCDFPFRPERVNIGSDLVLHRGFTLNADQSERPAFQRQRSKFTKVHMMVGILSVPFILVL